MVTQSRFPSQRSRSLDAGARHCGIERCGELGIVAVIEGGEACALIGCRARQVVCCVERLFRALPSPPAQAVEAGGGQGPARICRNDAPAGPQHGMGAGELVGGAADILAGVVQHEILEVDEFAFEPQRRAGVEEVAPGCPSVADRARAQPLVEPRQPVLGGGQRAGELRPRKDCGGERWMAPSS
jgi:hypothetical protein